MSNPFVDGARESMGAIERLLKGLPVVSGYVDKELRREADYRLRQTIATGLDVERQRLFDLQKKLSRSGGLRYVDDLDVAVQRLQTLVDRIKTASYGYAGLFSAQKIREEQLDALHRFDVALAARTYEIQESIDALTVAVERKDGIPEAIDALTGLVGEFNRLYDRRHQAVEDLDHLTPTAAPAVDESWMQAAEAAAEPISSAQNPENAAPSGGDADSEAEA